MPVTINGSGSVAGLAAIQQVTQTVDTTARSTTSTSFVTTNISATITPKSSSSRIIISVQGVIGFSTGMSCSYTLYRDSVDLNTYGKTGLFVASQDDTASGTTGTLSLQVVDSPATSSAITYTLYFRSGNGSFSTYLGRNNANTLTAPTYLTLMEVAA